MWIIGRTKTDGPADYDAVHKIQAGYKITPLSQWGKEPVPPEVKIDPSIDMKTPPKKQVDTMPAGKFFAYAAELLKLHPPHITDQPIIARLERIGFEVGKSFDLDKADPAVQKGLAKRAGGRPEADGVEGSNHGQDRQWLVDEHRHHGRLRQLLSQARHRHPVRPRRQFAGETRSIRSISPTPTASRSTVRATTPSISTRDKSRRSMPSGRSRSTIRKVSRWRIRLNRFAVSSWMPFHYNPDGSLDLYFQNESPGADKEANWLPAPKGPFNLTMRLYAPKSEALTGKWNPTAGDESGDRADRGPVVASGWHRIALS